MRIMYLLICWLVIQSYWLGAQSVGINTNTPHPNASLDVEGVNKGLLIPRGDVGSRNSLNSNTAKGLMMYDTTSNLLWVHNGNGLGSGWQSLSTGTNYWALNGSLGSEIANTNSGGFWSANESTVLVNPGVVMPPVSGAGTRMTWVPSKSVFRVGTVNGSNWDADSLGAWSVGMGYNVKASGVFSTALGLHTTANGLTSTALGFNTKASGENSIAVGSVTTANGANSMSIGFKTVARSYGSLSIGRFNDRITTSDSITWLQSDPLLILGNGTSESSLHNMFVIYKNGNIVSKNPSLININPGSIAVPVSGPGTRLMWVPEKSAFRAGSVDNNFWNADSLGTWSTGFGYSTKAKGSFSFSAGFASSANGITSTAFGYATVAGGENSIAMGSGSVASGAVSTSMGYFTTARGLASTAIGYYTKSDGENAVAMGSGTLASGNNSTSLGINSHARSYASVSIGRYNDTIMGSEKLTWINTDPLFTIGNGISSGALHNAMVVYKNANIIFKTATPVTTDVGVVPIPISGEGTRMMWLPEKGAFRAGTVVDTQWDALSIGTWSFAGGHNTIASGATSTALGGFTTASGDFAVALGGSSIASGYISTALGHNTKAIGNGSTSMGINTTATGTGSVAGGYGTTALGSESTAFGNLSKAKGRNSTALNQWTIAKGFSSTVIGMYNDSILTSDQTVIDPATPLFIIGNGDGVAPGLRHNAMVVYKNGNLLLKSITSINENPGIVPTPVIGSGTRMMWIPEKSAFRVGTVFATTWDAANIGWRSFACGENTLASGEKTTAMGSHTAATGNFSTALGSGSWAQGIFSVSIGTSNIAGGNYSLAMGYYSLANGQLSSTLGKYNIAKGYSSTVVGMYNDSILLADQTAVNETTTPLFIVGNGDGEDPGERRNAMVVYKSGNAELNGFTRLGKSTESAPKIKLKKLTGTSAGAQNAWTDVAHGLTMSKILAVDIIMTVPGFVNVPPSYTYTPGYQFNYHISATNIVVINSAANSSNILNRGFSILITYEE